MEKNLYRKIVISQEGNCCLCGSSPSYSISRGGKEFILCKRCFGRLEPFVIPKMEVTKLDKPEA